MATANYSSIYQSLIDPNSILGPNFLRVGARRLAGRSGGRPNPAMMAGSAGINPLSTTSIPSFPSAGPLIRTSRFSGPPSKRPDWRDPSQQRDAQPVIPFAPSTTGLGGTVPINDAIAQNNANMSDNQRRALDFLSLSPSSANVVRAVRQPEPSGIAGGTMSGLPEVSQQFPSQVDRDPMAPVTASLGGITERRGVRTAYGMVYPTSAQEAAGQELAMRRPMEGRMANVREQKINPSVVKEALKNLKSVNESGIPQSQKADLASMSLEGLTQAEKIAVMRQRGREIEKTRGKAMTEYFNTSRSEIAQGRKEKREAAKANQPEDIVSSRRGGQTTQRSWSNYTGDNPITNMDYDDEETTELARRRRRRGTA